MLATPSLTLVATLLGTEQGPRWVADRLPPVLVSFRFLDVQAWQWIGLAVAALLAFVVAEVLGSALRAIALRITRRTQATWDDRFVEAAASPSILLLALATFAVALRSLHLAVAPRLALEGIVRTLVIATFTWAGLRAIGFIAHLVEERFGGGDPFAARGVRTQVMVLRRVAGTVVLFVGSALVLLQFDGMRALGTSLLASAGVAGIVVGLAAQRSIATLLAGIQLSITQPVRVGDVVIIEGEWGTIEEITLTYVVVKIWDLRRLIVPITRFLEAPFQNWTRTGSNLLGTVFVHADYRVPVDVVRAELRRFAEGHPLWDGKVAGLQVTNVTDRAVELRALLSAEDAGRAFELRCAAREHLIGVLQRLEGGRHLPRGRLEADVGDAGERRNVAVNVTGPRS
ncbi:MAG TPA: mechanosensitive ion channel domain-containing protein [Anaeromyxobacteraceae bacterium]|nr:mechanosensitive ion channel domain-containing protein [Anaeromyxobacteraceae bacterium]